MLASRLYFRERSSTLYTVITAGEAVKVSSYAAGRAASCQLAAARQQSVGSAARGISQQRSGGSAVPASDGMSTTSCARDDHVIASS